MKPESRESSPRVSAIVLAYGGEPILEQCIHALLNSSGVTCEVLLVDNGCSNPFIQAAEYLPGVHVFHPPTNIGFTGGCNMAAKEARGDFLVFINSDAVVEPRAVAALVAALNSPGVGLTSASLRLYDRPHLMNSAGNPIHYLGVTWAGGLGQSASDFTQPRDVPGATGAAMACTKETWRRLGGFFEPMFAYCEDVELSLRVWQIGRRVVFVPDAEVQHMYEFSKNPAKMYLIERNRLAMLLTLYQARTLTVLFPAFLALEVAVLAVAVKQGWATQKVLGWWWLGRNWKLVLRRRHVVQQERVLADREMLHVLTSDFSPGAETGIRPPRILAIVSRHYWRVARAILLAERPH